jgi:hypothetical protein
MQYYYNIRTSRSQLILLHLVYLLAACIFYFCISPALLKWSALAALGISALREHRRLIRQGNLQLRVIPQRSAIELRQYGQPYFYCKYKVYQTRWFAILKLIDTQICRTLILNPDSFESTDCYRRCRYDLRQLEAPDAA